MRRTERPSARFLGLLHGQAVIRGDAQALAMVEARARKRGIMQAVSRHSSSYVVRRFSLDWMADHADQAAPVLTAPALPALKDSRERAERAPLRAVFDASHQSAA